MFPFFKNNDFFEAIKGYQIWLYLAKKDIILRYRRSKIGPLWLTLSMAIFIVTLGAVYSNLFNINTKEYMPFLAAGFITWTFIAGILNEFPNAFVDNANYIKDLKINPIVILLRIATRHLIILGHNILILLGIYIYYEINPGINIVFLLPGLFILTLNLVAIGTSLSLLGGRFRDVSPIVQSIVQILFFITPILWFPRLLPATSWIVVANPFAYFLDIIRSPILGQQPNHLSWIVALLTLLVFSWISLIFYSKKSDDIPYWV